MREQNVAEIPEPLRTVLRDYLHMNCYELDELVGEVNRPDWIGKFGAFQSQLRHAIDSDSIPLDELQDLTGQEFNSRRELKGWLTTIWVALYELRP